jgi:hypothetical protein
MGGVRAEQRVFQEVEQQIPRNDHVDEVSLARGIEGFLANLGSGRLRHQK